MTRPIVALPQTFLVAALMINLLLLLVVTEGVVVLRSAEASAERALPCAEWYNHPAVNGYFLDGRGWRANLLYALSMLAPGWLLGIGAAAVTFSLIWRGQRRWLPLATLAPLALALVALWPALQALGCALE